MKHRIAEIIAPLINRDAEYSMSGGCFVCGHPLDKEVRVNAVNDTADKLLKLLSSELPVKTNIYSKETDDLLQEGFNQCLTEIKRKWGI